MDNLSIKELLAIRACIYGRQYTIDSSILTGETIGNDPQLRANYEAERGQLAGLLDKLDNQIFGAPL